MPIHGGSLRVFVAPPRRLRACRERRAALLAEEAAWGVDRPGAVRGVRRAGRRARGRAASPCSTGSRARARTIAAYGAAAKGSTLLNFFGIGAETLDFVVDRSTDKQGRYMPGVHLRIDPPERLLEEMPDYLLLLAWNFADEIMLAAGRVPPARRQVHRPRPRSGGGVSVIDGVQVIPLRRIPDERGTVMHMLRDTDPHFQRLRRDLLLDGLPRRRQGLAPPPRDDAELRVHPRPHQAGRSSTSATGSTTRAS